MRHNLTWKLLHTKETINNNKRQATEWKNVFTNDMAGKGLITKMHKQLKQQKYQENKQPDSTKWAEDLKRHFSREDSTEG